MSDHGDHASPRTPKRGIRRKLVIGAALAAAATAGGLAFGEWLASGNGEGYAKSGVAQALTTESVQPSDTLYPGGKSDLVLRIHNPNPFPVAVHSVMPNGPITSDDPACDAAGHGVTFSGAAVSYLIDGNSSHTYTITDALSMATTSANECQNRQFTIPVALNAPISSGPTWYLDADGDGFGDPNMSQQSDTPPAGYIANNGDCNDSNSTIYPNAPEILNMLDDNCDGIVDNGNFYGDADADGFSVVQGDCNDTDASINPGATEVVGDGIDNNCNGTIDEGGTSIDVDADGYSVAQGDCKDTDASINPGATEVVGDGIDNNCNGTIDEG